MTENAGERSPQSCMLFMRIHGFKSGAAVFISKQIAPAKRANAFAHP